MQPSSPTYPSLDAALRHVLVAERVRQGHSQASFARACGVERRALGRYEFAEKTLAIETLVRVARALQTPLSKLIAAAEEMVSDA